MDLTLNQLRSFVTVAEELHFGRAALRLQLSQPQVSRHVRSLEDTLGVVLFARGARQITLTGAGAALLEDVRETLAAVERLRARAAAVGRAPEGRVTVGFTWSTLGRYLPALVTAVAEHHRQIDLSVSQLRFAEVIPALRRGEVDIAITRVLFQESEMVQCVLARERSLLAIPAGHELASRATVAVADLDRQPMIALVAAVVPGVQTALQESMRDQGVILRVAQEAHTPSEALALVSAGIGLYRLPESAARPHPGVVYRELQGALVNVLMVRRPEPPAPAVAAIERLARWLFDAQGASNNGAGSLQPSVPAA